jgi:hypothetical protein
MDGTLIREPYWKLRSTPFPSVCSMALFSVLMTGRIACIRSPFTLHGHKRVFLLCGKRNSLAPPARQVCDTGHHILHESYQHRFITSLSTGRVYTVRMDSPHCRFAGTSLEQRNCRKMRRLPPRQSLYSPRPRVDAGLCWVRRYRGASPQYVDVI